MSMECGSSENVAAARYHCSICRRPFDRKDTLTRHRRVHDPTRLLPKSRKKSCVPCARAKIKCLGERPFCSSCQKRNTPCLYQNTENESAQPGAHTLDHSSFPSPEDSHVGQDSSPSSTSGAISMGLPVAQSSATNFPCFGADPSLVTPFGGGPSAMLDSDFTYDLAEFSVGAGIDLQSNLDWLFDPQWDASSLQMKSPNDYRNVTLPGLFGLPTGVETPHISAAAQTSLDSIDESSRDPNALDAPKISEPTLHEACNAEDPWPMEWHAQAPDAYFVLPSFGQGEHNAAHSSGKFFSIAPITESLRSSLQKYLNLAAKCRLWQTTDLNNWPSCDKLDLCIDLYFAHFHPVMPIIHQATFDPAEEHVVTLVLICIGALYTEYADAAAFSNALSELVRCLLGFMAEYDRRFVRTEAYLTAQLLQGVSGYCAGSQRLFELSESSRSMLVHHAMCMGLFRGERSQDSEQRNQTADGAWQHWIRHERLCRLGWAVIEYDASVAWLHNNRPHLQTTDINLPLPSPDREWSAESSQVWTSLHTRARGSLSKKLFRPLLRSLFDGTENPIGNFREERHRFLVILMLTRMIWSCKEIRSSALNDIVPDGLDEGRVRVQAAVDSLYQCPLSFAKTHTDSELARMVYRLCLIHISHLYEAGDLMNRLYPYIRNSPESEGSRASLAFWAAADASRVRRVTHHCSQLLALTRHFPTNSPWEPFIIFTAGVVLSCMPEVLQSAPCASNSVRLDILGATTSEANLVSSWIREGGNVNISLHGVPSLCSSLGRQQVLNETTELLKRRRVWSVAHSFTRVVLSLRKKLATG